MNNGRHHLDGSCIIDCLVGQALDGMCVGLVLMNGAGRVTWMNRAAETTLGLGRDDGKGQLLSQVLRDPQFAAFWHEARDAEGGVMSEVSVHWPRPAELKVNATHCRDREGGSLGRALLFCDVTHEHIVQLQLSREATQRLMDLTDSWQDNAHPVEGLTEKEVAVLRLVGKGLSNPEIADALDVAASTVRSHLKHVYAKLGLGSRSEAISYAIQNGLA